MAIKKAERLSLVKLYCTCGKHTVVLPQNHKPDCRLRIMHRLLLAEHAVPFIVTYLH